MARTIWFRERYLVPKYPVVEVRVCTGVPKGTGKLLVLGGVIIVRDLAGTVRGDLYKKLSLRHCVILARSVLLPKRRGEGRLVSGLATWQAETGAERSWNRPIQMGI